MKFNEYQKQAHEFACYTTNNYPIMGLAEECGEVLGKFAKIDRDQNNVINDDNIQAIKKELGDVLWFLSEIAHNLGLSLDDVAKHNLEKLRDRKKRNVIHGSGDNR